MCANLHNIHPRFGGQASLYLANICGSYPEKIGYRDLQSIIIAPVKFPSCTAFLRLNLTHLRGPKKQTIQ